MTDIIAGALVVACVFWMIFGAVSTYLEIRPNKNEEPKFQPTTPEFKCSHTWKDFPWYMESTYYIDARKLYYTITKPYVCIHCKERRDEELLDIHIDGVSRDEAEVILTDIKKEFSDKIAEKPLVEEMILDMQLVDRKALEIAQQIGIIEENK